jgi:hypothetical protein
MAKDLMKKIMQKGKGLITCTKEQNDLVKCSQSTVNRKKAQQFA